MCQKAFHENDKHDYHKGTSIEIHYKDQNALGQFKLKKIEMPIDCKRAERKFIK